MKIALVGSAPSSVHLAPYMDASYSTWLQGKPAPQFPPSDAIDDDWEIWGVSPGVFGVALRLTRWFEVHRWEPGKSWFSPEYCQFLREFRGQVYTGGVVPEIPNHVVYPIERVEAEFSAYFLHSSLSLMLAVAILEIEDDRRKMIAAAGGAQPNAGMQAWLSARDDMIGLWGVDMAANEEYGDQRSGCHFFILEALRRGIKVYVPPESCLLRPKPVYGLSEWDHSYIKATARMREFNARKEAHTKAFADAQNALHAVNGMMENMKYFIDTWMSPYGLPAGVTLEHNGDGLGGGFTVPTAEHGPVESITTSQVIDQPYSDKSPPVILESAGAAHSSRPRRSTARKSPRRRK